MVTYIRSDLDFILTQIKIAEAHAGGQPLYGVDGALIPTYNLAWGLRTVDGSYNNLLHPTWGAADQEFPEHLGTVFRPAAGTPLDMDGPGPAPAMPTAPNYNPSTDANSIVVDPSLRTISNLIVDQTLGNPSAILTGLQRAGIVAAGSQITVTQQITALYEPLKPLFNAVNTAARVNAEAQAAASASPGNAALQQAAVTAAANLLAAQTALDAADNALVSLLTASGIELDGANIVITNAAPDEGLSAPFNSWFTLFGQFFDHGLDLIAKGGAGTVFIPLLPDDPLYDPTSPTNFMVLTRATNIGPGADGILVDNPATAINEAADNTDRPVNTTTPFVDQNQTYSSHPSHQVFLRQYAVNGAGDPVSTGKLMEGGNGGMATWGELKVQAATLLGIQLLDVNVGNIPLLATDQYGNFIPGTNGFPQIVTATGLVEGNPAANGGLGVLVPANAFFTGHAFLADIAHNAVPDGLADGDIEIGLNNPGFEPGAYDDELLDAHYVAGDGRANENIGLTAVHHVFHAEHNRLVEHTKEVVIADANAMLLDGATPAAAVAFLNEWLIDDVATVPATGAGLIWDGERLFQAAKFGTEMQYQHLVFEEFARKIQPNINVFLVPDGYDVTIDPSIVAEFAHVIYRFGHSMLTETIDRFDPTFTPDQIGLIEGFLNPIQFANNGGDTLVEDGISAGAIIRGMTRQAGNEIDEFVTSALRNNLLGLPLDLATINLARGRDTGVPSLNEARSQFYEATNHDALLKPYESWVDFAGHLKHEASIINFIAAYGTHATILAADTIEEKRDAAMALVGLTSGSGGTGSTPVAISNASFEADSLASGGPGVIVDPLGNYTTTAPTGWTMTGTGGMFAPAAGVTNPAGIQGTNVVWLSQDTMLARDTGVVLAAGANYSLTFDIGDRTDMAWPGGVARLVSSDGTLLASQLLAAPADGNWSTVTFQTGAIAAGTLVGQTLRIEIQQTGGTGNQILVDDIQLNVLQPLPPQTPLDEVDRQAFLNGTGQYAGNLGGLNLVDLWIGGLAEEIMPFGGMLGSTFNFVFETQMEKLQNGDRFYYLQRLDGLHLFGEMENNSFAAMIMRNTDATHLPSDVFSTPGLILEVDQTKQFNDLDGDGDLETTDPVGEGILTQLVIRNNPATPGTDTNYLKYTGGDHVVLGGTNNNDTLIAGIGDDTLFGDAGNDRLEGGFGNDIINGGDGDDIIVDSGGDDNIKAGKGNDVVHAGPGLDLVMGNDGQDFIFLGTDMGSEVFAGTGNDFIYGNKNAERILGNEGNDWIETGTFDGAPGDNFDEIFSHDTIDGHDVFLGDGGFDEFIGEGGDDIFVGSAGRGKMVGMSGFDWATYKDNPNFVNADLSIPIVFDEAPTLPQNASLDEYESVEGLSGTKGNDVLTGTDMLAADRLPTLQGGTEGYQGSALDAEGIALIAGLQALLGAGVTSFSAGDIILGGDGSDLIMGKAGDDIIDGDKWLDVQIGVFAPADVNHTGTPIALHNSMTTLAASMFDGTINPGQLSIVRTIRTDTTVGDIDVARYQGARGDYVFGATADGRIRVTDATELNLDGSDTLSGIERLRFGDNSEVGLIVGSAGNDVLNGTAQGDLILGLAGADTLNGLGGDDILVGGADGATTTSTPSSYADTFNTQSLGNSNGAPGGPNWGPDWIETGDNGSANNGQIQIDDDIANVLGFVTGDGAQIQRTVNLAGAATASLGYSIVETGLDAGADNDSVTVFFSRDGINFVQVDQITSTTDTPAAPRNIDLTLFGTGPFTANAAHSLRCIEP